MTTRLRTIQIYLPAGDPRGIRVAELTTGIVRVIEVPRSLLDAFLAMSESQQVGLYLLVNDDDEQDSSAVYIGQTGGTGTRLVQHHKSKEFWNRALVAVSLTNSLTNTHALYLEWLAIKEANAAARFRVENGTAGSKPHTPAPLEADCRDLFDSIRTLVATLGQPVFEPLSRSRVVNGVRAEQVDAGSSNASTATEAESERFHCRSTLYDATAEYTPEGMVVLKGSRARRDPVPSFLTGRGASQRRDALIKDGALVLEGDFFVFRKDVLFKSPSAAADVIRGAASNGWEVWIDRQGRSLDQLKRQPALAQASVG